MADNIFSKHKEAYLREAHALVEKMNAALLQLEKNPQDKESLQEIFRAAHTMKSNSAMMNYHQSADLCHLLEDILDALRNNQLVLNQCTEILFAGIDFLKANLKKLDHDNAELDASVLIDQAKVLLSSGQSLIKQPQTEKKAVSAAVEKIHSIEVKVERLDTLMKLAEELLVNRLKLDLLRDTINHPELTATVDTLSRVVMDMQYNIMQIRLLPIGIVFERFFRMVRDLAKLQHKEVQLEVEGGDIELDRTLLDEIAESLAHLIRNAIDHGLETPAERKKAGKKPQGTLRLVAKRSKESVTIEVSDDGQGLDLKEIKQVAMRNNLIDSHATPEDLRNLIFEGLTTTKEVTQISGRGLGLGIVKQKIESISGVIWVESKEEKGTQFFIKIPLTLAVIKVLFVKVGERIYAVPLDNIERLLTVSAGDFKGILEYEAIVYANDDIPITHLATLFNETVAPNERQQVVVVKNGDDRLGIAVDQLLTTQEVVIKPLGKIIKSNRFFSGSVLLGSGEVVLILDVAHLFLSKRINYARRKSDAS